MTAVYRQFGQVPFSYVNGLRISNDATTPNSVLDVAIGTILDSTQTFQLSLSTAATLSSAKSGLNGLDTGTVAASTLYYVYLVADPVTLQATGLIMSLALASTGPLMPFGYSAYALLGHVVTDSSSHFLPGIWSAGDSSRRTFIYDAPQATSITAGAATTYTAIDLTALVPAVDKIPVYINSAFTPGAASRTLKLQPTGGTGDAITITGQVTSVIVTSSNYLFSRLVTAKPEISYIVSNAGDAANIKVAGFDFFL